MVDCLLSLGILEDPPDGLPPGPPLPPAPPPLLGRPSELLPPRSGETEGRDLRLGLVTPKVACSRTIGAEGTTAGGSTVDAATST